MSMSFSREHYEKRLYRIRQHMDAGGYAAVIFCKCDTVRYVTGFRRWYSYSFFYLREFAVVSASHGPVLLTDRGRFARARANCYVEDVRDSCLWPVPRGDYDAPCKALAATLKDMGIDSGLIGIEADFMPVDFYLRLKRFMVGYELSDFSGEMNEVIKIKFGPEIDAMRESARLADVGLSAGVTAAVVGATEQQVAAEIEAAMMAAGAERVSHNVVRTGENVLGLNNIQTGRNIIAGDLVQLDLGGIYKGYYSDVNITYVVGEPTAEQRQLYEINLEMLQNGISAVRPGATVAELRARMKGPAVVAGLGHCATGDVGHGIGIYHQEFPKIAEDDGLLEPGMVLCLEPGLVVVGVGAARKEDIVLVTETGHDVMTKFALP
jgi:Xaa-Pro aminopeptidase